MQSQRVFLRAAAAEADEAVESPLFVIRDDGFGHVVHAAINHHAVRLVAARAENRAAHRENARER